jgi:hypothetical protein
VWLAVWLAVWLHSGPGLPLGAGCRQASAGSLHCAALCTAPRSALRR